MNPDSVDPDDIDPKVDPRIPNKEIEIFTANERLDEIFGNRNQSLEPDTTPKGDPAGDGGESDYTDDPGPQNRGGR